MRYEVTGESLTSVADAIRERAGTTELLAFPEEYESVVRGIPDYLGLKLTNQPCLEYRNDVITELPANAFIGWGGLKGVYFPNLTIIRAYSLHGTGCSKLDFPKLETIEADSCAWSSLETLIIRTNAVCTLGSANAFTCTAISNGTGYIYVPRALVDSYKAATNWSTYASQIRAIEDYSEITGG